MATTRLTRTLGTPTNRKKLTLSMWLKKSFNGVEKHFFGMGASGGYLDFRFASTDELELYHYNAGYQFRLTTTRKFRDTNAWYHLVFAIDTTLGTADDRFKVYVNGVQETVFTNRTNPSTDYELGANVSGNTISVGNYGTNTTKSFDGLISHVHFSDGYVYQASDFGSTDSITGEWKIKTSPSGITYGTNGFWWLKDNIATTDHSPNSNTFTVASGTLTKTEDNPSNVFCTLNPLIKFSTTPTLSNGNLSITENAANWQLAASTLGVSEGKWYYEYKATSAGASGLLHKVGFMSEQLSYSVVHIAETAVDGGYAWYTNSNGEVRTDNAVISGWASSDITNITSISAGDIMMVAVDMDNKYAYFGVNGVWAKSGDPTSGSSGTGGLDISSDYPTGKILIPAVAVYSGCAGSINFGNGYFGTTAVSSAGTNASGIGIFEHDVPNGYTSLSTKGLNL